MYGRLGTGSVQSIGEGSTTVSLSANGTRQSMNVTVTLPTARVDISPRSLRFEALEDTKSVTVKVLDENGDEDEDATWSAIGFFSPCCGPDARNYLSGAGFEIVDGGLEVTSGAPGTGQITISSADVESAILGVTVYMKPASVEVSPSSADLEVDGTTTLTATIEDANGNSIHVNQDDGRGGRVVYWETSDSAVATVEGSDATEDHNTGVTATVTAVAAGSATVTARHGSGSYRVSNTATVTVEEPARPDLEVATPTVDDTTPETGATFMLSATVSNAGDGESPAATLRYYRSTDATISSADTQVGTDAVGALSASGTSAQSISLTAPATAGTYYYGACVDAVTGESDTTNNCSSSVQVTVPQPPDLRIQTIAAPSSITVGESFNLLVTVLNAGDGESVATTLRYYRSTDVTITTADTEVGTDDVGVLSASGTSAESISLTAPSSAGTYYYGACVDTVTDESDTTNNCSSSAQVIVEENEEQQQGNPDLEVESPSVNDSSPAAGTSFTLSLTVSNTGDGESPATTLGYYMSTDATTTTSNTAVARHIVGALAPGATSDESGGLRAPVTAGTYYYRACVDTVTDESDTTNNCSASVQVTVAAAARVEVTPNPVSLDAVGATATLTATVFDTNDEEMQSQYYGWSSEDKTVATVRHLYSGTALRAIITAVGPGTTTVTFGENDVEGSTVEVTVTVTGARVEISPRSLTFDALGQTKSVTVRVLDENGDEDEDASFGYFGIFNPCCRPNLADPLKSVAIVHTDDRFSMRPSVYCAASRHRAHGR